MRMTAMRMTAMSEAAPAYRTPAERKPSRMRKTTADAADRAMVMIERDGVRTEVALQQVGISRRSYERYIDSITVVAPETARPLGGSQSVPAPLPLFAQEARLANIEASLRKCDEFIGQIDRRMARAAELLNDAAHVLANWPKP